MPLQQADQSFHQGAGAADSIVHPERAFEMRDQTIEGGRRKRISANEERMKAERNANGRSPPDPPFSAPKFRAQLIKRKPQSNLLPS